MNWEFLLLGKLGAAASFMSLLGYDVIITQLQIVGVITNSFRNALIFKSLLQFNYIIKIYFYWTNSVPISKRNCVKLY